MNPNVDGSRRGGVVFFIDLEQRGYPVITYHQSLCTLRCQLPIPPPLASCLGPPDKR